MVYIEKINIQGIP